LLPWVCCARLQVHTKQQITAVHTKRCIRASASK
jgi:hypothetical protein